MKFVDNVKDSWRWFSMQIAGLGLASVSAWGYIPQEWRDYILQHGMAQWLIGGTFAAIMFGRIIQQGSK